MTDAIAIERLEKTYASGFQALKPVDLAVRRGEIFALLGPNGAGKTTLISIVCGIVNPTGGRVLVEGHDILRQARVTRALIGLVPQELTTDSFESVIATVTFSRGLFGKPADPAHIERVLRDLSLWDKRDTQIRYLSGGMKRRVLIAKALSHEPKILFLDEPTAGVDVELRRDMWEIVRDLKRKGVTVVLTTHYIQEAEEMADRIGVMSRGELLVVDEKANLMRRLGRKTLILRLAEPLAALPPALSAYDLTLTEEGRTLTHAYAATEDRPPVGPLLADLGSAGVVVGDVETRQSSLEDIFVDLVHGGDAPDSAPTTQEAAA